MIELLAPGRFTYIGIDSDEEKIKDAKLMFCDDQLSSYDAYFYTSLDEIDTYYDKDKTMVLLSSVLHELFSYLPYKDATGIVMKIFDLDCKYVAIRDMDFWGTIHYVKPSELWDELEGKGIDDEIFLWKKMRPDSKVSRLEDQNLIEFLMSYIHKANLEREITEHYFDTDYTFICEYADNAYRKMWEHNFRLPYLERKWREELFAESENYDRFIKGIKTHTELLFERR